jgi:hypothetical protein
MARSSGSGRRAAVQATSAQATSASASAIDDGARGVSRRQFMQRGIGLGASVGLMPFIGGCVGDDDGDPRPTRTLFFNLSHEAHEGKTYYYHGVGQKLKLTPVKQNPGVLARERQNNRFLAAVGDEHITHHVEGAVMVIDSVALNYVTADDTSAGAPQGAWTMSGLHFAIPPQSAAVAFERRRIVPSPQPSAARRRYGLSAAATAQDFADETALVDTTVHAQTLMCMHPDTMALHPDAAATVMCNHASQSLYADALESKLSSLGAASRAGNPGTTNPQGWGTLQPLVDANGQPLTNADGRLKYRLDLHPDVHTLVGQGVNDIHGGVKDDASLGADVTQPQAPGAHAGALWARRDGRPNFDQSPSPAADVPDNIQTALTHLWPNRGLDVTTSDTLNADNTVSISVSFTNWYLRYLGAYVQFVDSQGNVKKLLDIPEYSAQTMFDASVGHKYRKAGDDPATTDSVDTDDAVWLGLVPAINTIMGIPLLTEGGAGSLSATFKMPAIASTARFLCGGLGGQGANSRPDLCREGIGMTSFFNYGITALCASAGAGTKYPIIINTLATTLGDIANNLAAFLVDKSSGADTSQFWSDQSEALVETIIGNTGSKVLSTMIGLVIGIVTESEIEKAVPIIGVVSQVISALIGAADIILTSVDVGTSPWLYSSDLALTQDVSVQLTPSSATFAAAANAYKVTAIVDSGTPYTQTLPMAGGEATLPAVVFKGMPRGGNITITACVKQSAITATADDIMLGRGTSGSVVNTAAGQTLQVDEIAFPVGPTTTYQHKQKSALDDAGNHVWQATPTAPATNLQDQTCGDAGTICDYHSITIRQDTKTTPGYLGYSWQSQNQDPNDVPGCTAGIIGQLDQAANLNTGPTAQSGYAATPCATTASGVHLTYSLLGQTNPDQTVPNPATSNFYLDPSAADDDYARGGLIRKVNLDGTPNFDAPGSGQAWGALNMASDMLVLHPSGHLVSINNANHKLEVHPLPKASQADGTARRSLLAQVHSGQGSRPGLINSPTALAVSADGHVLVLEAGNNRIQALDLGANAVPIFAKQATAPHYLTLTEFDADDGWLHLDLAVEFTGFMYVLSYNQLSYEYVMHVYHPSQADTRPICQTSGVNAARLTVDLWRNVYTLNYEVIGRSNPNNTTPPGITEPSVSLWTPCNLGQTC